MRLPHVLGAPRGRIRGRTAPVTRAKKGNTRNQPCCGTQQRSHGLRNKAGKVVGGRTYHNAPLLPNTSNEVRIRLLATTQDSPPNTSISVSELARVQSGEAGEVRLAVDLKRSEAGLAAVCATRLGTRLDKAEQRLSLIHI